MPHKRKGDTCLNCQEPLTPEMNYCPACGQENDDRHVSIWVLGAEHLEELLGLDSKLFKSLVPFLLQPGKLTAAFRSGQRKAYVPPLRMYLVVSVLFFLTASVSLNRTLEDDLAKTSANLKEALAEDSSEVTSELDSATIQELTLSSKKGLTTTSTESKADSNNIEQEEGSDSTTQDTSTSDKGGFSFSIGDKSSGEKKTNKLHLNLKDKSEFTQLCKSDTVSDTLLVEEMNMDVNQVSLRLAHQIRKFVVDKDAATQDLVKFLLENGSLASLAMLPFLALWLKLLFRKSKTRFAIHFVHALHLMSFMLLMLILSTLTELWFWDNENHPVVDTVDDIGSLAVLVYALFSFKRVYYDGWVKTIFKYLLYWVCFGFTLFVVGMTFAFVGFVLF